MDKIDIILAKLKEDRSSELDSLDDKYSNVLLSTNTERYDYFKEYVAQKHFIDLKYDFLNDTHGTSDEMYIKSLIHGIEQLRKHPTLKNGTQRLELYGKAVNHMSHIINDELDKKGYLNSQNILYNIVLHEENYFANVTLPDDAFGYWGASNNIWQSIIDIYAKYFLFYGYLQSLLFNNEKINTPNKSGEVCSLFQKPLWIGPDYKDEILNLLSQTNLDISMPFITINDNIPKWTKHKAYGQYAAGLIQVLSQNGWLDNGQTPSRDYSNTFKETFNIKIDPKPFRQISYEGIEEKYLVPFKSMIEQITSNNK